MLKNSIYILIILIVAASCTERIEIELDDTYTRLVVQGDFTNEAKAHRIQLSKTGSFLENEEDEPVTGASVSISSSRSTYVLTESLEEQGVYYTDADVKGEPGENYMLHIELAKEIDGRTIYTAESPMQYVGELDSIAVEYDDRWEVWEVKCYATDPVTEDFYMFDTYRNHIMITDTLSEKMVVDDKFYNGQYTNGIGVGWLDPEQEDQALQPGDTVTLRMASITKEYATFIWNAQSELFNNPLFGGPPANVKGNVSNGAIGYFAVFAVTYSSTILD